MREIKSKKKLAVKGLLLSLILIMAALPMGVLAKEAESATESTAWVSPFKDVKVGDWYYNSTAFVIENELFNGKTDDIFAPNDKMTRGMFITVLGRLSKEDPKLFVSSEALSYTDVKDDFYYMPYIEWATKKKIVAGVGNYKFAPDRAITREEMALIMNNYAKVMGVTLKGDSEIKEFPDIAQISSWAKDGVRIMQQAGVIAGRENGNFAPKATATRAEVATLTERFAVLEKAE